MATALSLLMAPTVLARRAQVEKSSFDTFADWPTPGDDIHGNHMINAAVGKTIVTVSVSGLSQGATYGSHVRNQACADVNAGGHYRS